MIPIHPVHRHSVQGANVFVASVYQVVRSFFVFLFCFCHPLCRKQFALSARRCASCIIYGTEEVQFSLHHYLHDVDACACFYDVFILDHLLPLYV